MTRLFVVAALAAGMGCAPCDALEDQPCRDPEAITGEIVSRPLREPVVADLVVSGTLDAPANATVYRVAVNGIDATQSSPDFRNWTATIPLAVLVAGAQKGVVSLSAVAVSNCGSAPSVLDTRSVKVSETPGIVVSRLAIISTLASGVDYLPASAPGSALLTITANPEAAGASVSTVATGGTLSAAQATLSGDGVVDATAQVLLAASTPGVATVTAMAQGQAAVRTVLVVGAPTFAPDGTALKSGDSLRVTVVTTGRVTSCQATPARGVHVTSGPDSDLMRGTGGVDLTNDQLIDLDISVDRTLVEPTTTTLSCRDPWGQVGTATFIAAP